MLKEHGKFLSGEKFVKDYPVCSVSMKISQPLMVL